jgi:hypothetical protein
VSCDLILGEREGDGSIVRERESGSIVGRKEWIDSKGERGSGSIAGKGGWIDSGKGESIMGGDQ